MLASELNEELEKLVDRYGDCIVTINATDRAVGEVRLYDIDGKFDGKVVEFSLIEAD